jgi:hypothetical protein
MIEMQARIFDDVRPDEARLFLLKPGENTSKFVVVAEIVSGWNVVFDREYRDNMKVSIATADPAVVNQIGQSTSAAYGIGASGSEIDVYSFDKKDSTGPKATSPSWKIYCLREDNKRFVIP